MEIDAVNNQQCVTVQQDNDYNMDCDIVSIFSVQGLAGQFIALNPLYDTEYCSTDEIHLFSLMPLGIKDCYSLEIIDDDVFGIVLDEFYKIIEE